MNAHSPLYRSTAAGLVLAMLAVSPLHAQEQAQEQAQDILGPDPSSSGAPPAGNVFARPLPPESGVDGSSPPPSTVLDEAPPANIFAFPMSNREDPPRTDLRAINDVQPPDTVLNRWLGRHHSLGIKAGSFVVRPELSQELGIDTNPNRTEAGKFDLVSLTRAGVEAQSVWSRHQLAADASVEQRLFARSGRLNQTPWQAGLRGRLDVDHSTFVTANARATELYTDNAVSEELDTTPLPARYHTNQFSLAGESQHGSVQLIGDVTYQARDFADTRTAVGARVDQQYRDFERTSILFSPGYALGPTMSAFGSVQLDRLDYRLDQPRGRDSDGISVLFGMRGELTRLFRGQIAVGLTARDYAAPGFDETAYLAFDTRLEWLPTGLTTVRLAASRRATNSASFAAPTELRTRVSLGADHELRRDVLVSAEWNFQDSRYPDLGGGTQRHQLIVGGEWFVTPRWQATASVQGTHQTGNQALGGIDYDRVSVISGLAHRF